MRALFLVIVAYTTSVTCGSQISPDSFFGKLSPTVVSEMQRIFVIRDGSSIQNPVDPVVLQAVYNELLVLSGNFSSMASVEDVRNATHLGDTELVRLLLLAIMGNFHAQTLRDAEIYNDVQVVYDPNSQHFITKQNMRDTEIVVFQVLLVICVFGIFMVFMVGSMDKHKHEQKVAPSHQPAHDTSSSHIGVSIPANRLSVPSWSTVGSRLSHRGMTVHGV